MVSTSSIEWTDATWNPVAGCTVISPGCTNCYAMRLAQRLSRMGQGKYEGLTRKSGGRAKWNGKIKLDWNSLDAPRRWKASRVIFVNSMSDLFHKDVPTDFLQAVFRVMRETPQHTYQILTKRAERLADLGGQLEWPTNVWMGVSVESKELAWRIDRLRTVPAFVRFLSLEPLLGPLPRLDLRNIHWVIVGGESGPGARSMEEQWVRDIRDHCGGERVAFHFKQWGGTNKKRTGRVLDGRTWDGLPDAVQSNLVSETIL